MLSLSNSSSKRSKSYSTFYPPSYGNLSISIRVIYSMAGGTNKHRLLNISLSQYLLALGGGDGGSECKTEDSRHGPQSEPQFPEVIPVLTQSSSLLRLLQEEKTSPQLTRGVAAVDLPALKTASCLQYKKC
ncbi:hypothetical protein GYMLUDRAFT_879558 [Collybiopsis luxurians FD-317 M1]|uniref:Uncharacterized protein n=1 Tax=Collybiopsis luxurians FD-317 M1 TaxID=944289 RepID=A0A0D0AXA4_9AGAR|nr:hypothetical protein GYMLUDRAFT_879558 [Collybiopsis luxurians FD-317 M1]